jgi:hypothetical protein
MSREIKCIIKTNRPGIHEGIHSVGGDILGVRWRKTEVDVIAEIERRTEVYYVNKGGKPVLVVVAQRLGKKYLKTEADGELQNNLLSLPECS